MNTKPRSSLFPRLLPVLLSLAVAATPLRAQEKERHYLPAGRPDFAALLAPPPLPGSAEQAADLAEVSAIVHACSSNDAALAMSEKKFTITNFAPAIGPFLQAGRFPKTEAFVERVEKDAAAAGDAAKDYWKRPRPFVVDPSLASGKLEKTFSYPCGHATEGMVMAFVLADLFPDRQNEILAFGRDLGWRRLWIGRHYATDVYAGRALAQAIVRELKASPEFQKDLAEARSEIATATEPAKPGPGALQTAAGR
jgi:acid phosphatase (class A)